MMDIMWFPAIVVSFISLGLILLYGRWQVGYTLALCVLIMAGVAFGWWMHGGLVNNQAMNYYYAGEANGYNRGYQAGKLEVLGTANITISELPNMPTQFDLWCFD